MVYIPTFTIKIKHSCGVNIPYMDPIGLVPQFWSTAALVLWWTKAMGRMLTQCSSWHGCCSSIASTYESAYGWGGLFFWGGSSNWVFNVVVFGGSESGPGLCRREHRNLQAGLQTLYHSMHLDVRMHLTAMRLTTEVTPRISLLATDFKQVLAQQNMKS